MKDERVLKVLLVEDSDGDARLVKEMLKSEGAGSFHVDRVKRFEEAMKRLGRSDYDLVLLDMYLPDSQGFGTLVKACSQAPGIPKIALSVVDDETLALKAIGIGMQDFIVKTCVDGKILVRSILHSIERHKLSPASGKNEKTVGKELSSCLLDRFAFSPKNAITAQLFGFVPLCRSQPETFKELVACYEELLDEALKQQTHNAVCDMFDNMSDKLQALSERLGFLRLGPREVIEIHATALRQQTQKVSQSKAMVYVEEGRNMVLELMGYLVSYYRKYSYAALRQSEFNYCRKDRILKIKDKIGRLDEEGG
ncbi:MAG: response regulator [Nitrospirae bacterium]|nr:response regulator [Nitrospirota bacterium]